MAVDRLLVHFVDDTAIFENVSLRGPYRYNIIPSTEFGIRKNDNRQMVLGSNIIIHSVYICFVCIVNCIGFGLIN